MDAAEPIRTPRPDRVLFPEGRSGAVEVPGIGLETVPVLGYDVGTTQVPAIRALTVPTCSKSFSGENCANARGIGLVEMPRRKKVPDQRAELLAPTHETPVVHYGDQMGVIRGSLGGHFSHGLKDGRVASARSVYTPALIGGDRHGA